MKYLFIGQVLRNEDIYWFKKNSKTNIQVASNNFQWNFIKGIDYNVNSEINIISTCSIGSYPFRFKKLIIKSKIFNRGLNSFFCYIGFINFYFIKGFIRTILITIRTKEWINRIDKDGVIFVYSLYTPFLISMFLLRNKFRKKNIKYCLIITDIPGKFGIREKQFSVSSLYEFTDYYFVKHLCKYADFYVVLTKYMTKSLNISNKPSFILEGFVSTEQINISEKLYSKKENLVDKKIILYTGSLKRIFGIDLLIKAFLDIYNDDIELWICGPIDQSKNVCEYCVKDTRIKYLGFLDHENILRLQTIATILVNPRPNEGGYVKNSFPSKTFEYLLSGTPLVMFKLDCIPDEYLDYIYFVEKSDIESLRAKLIEVCNKDENELKSFGKFARNFVINHKNNNSQISKLINKINISI